MEKNMEIDSAAHYNLVIHIIQRCRKTMTPAAFVDENFGLSCRDWSVFMSVTNVRQNRRNL